MGALKTTGTLPWPETEESEISVSFVPHGDSSTLNPIFCESEFGSEQLTVHIFPMPGVNVTDLS